MRYVKSKNTAWPAAAVVLAAISLAGCPAATGEASIGFPAEKLTLSIPPMTLGRAAVPLTLPEAMGGGDLRYTLTPIPAGLTFDASTRVLSGTPASAGTHRVTYAAASATDRKASVMFVITVRPTITGTWSSTHEWSDDDERSGTFVDTLTFTDTRYIQARVHYRHDGTIDHTWNISGGWSETDANTLTRVWEDDHDDRDDTPPVMMTVPKRYLWGDDARNLLFMHHWADDQEQTHHHGLDFHERVADPLSSGVTGVWEFTDDWDQGPVVIEMKIGTDGTFTWELRETHGTERIIAMWTLDEGTNFLDFRGASATWTPQGGTAEPVEDFKADRIAFAPTDSPDLIVVSPHWHETEGNDEYRRYGNYWMEFRRQ